MTGAILNHIDTIDDLLMFSKAFKKGAIHVNISKLSRELNKDRKTVRKYLNGHIPKKTRTKVKYLDEYREYIYEVLTDPIRSFDYIEHLFKFLKREKNITCSRSALVRYIRSDEELTRLFKRKKDVPFTERFETLPGQQAQFDLKEKVKLVDKYGNFEKIYIPTLTLGWSRYNVRALTLDTKTETLLAFLAKAFEEIGGVPKELVIDNLKSFVDIPRKDGKNAILGKKFDEFLKDYGIIPKPCMPSRPQTKGKTETQNKIVDQLKNYNGTYQDLTAMHKMLEITNSEDNENISQATNFPRNFLLIKEKGDFLPLPSVEIREKYHLTLKEVIVTPDSTISYKSCRYSLPKTFIGKKVGLVVQGDELQIYYNDNIVTRHLISNNKLNIKKEHELFYPSKEESSPSPNTNIINELKGIKYD